MSLEFTIDWLNFTNTTDGNKEPTDSPYPFDNTWEIAGAGKGYNASLQNEQGIRVSWHTDREDMGIHIQYAGRCLIKCNDLGVTPKQIAVYHHTKRHRCSRIDLAIDTKSEGLSIRKLALFTRKNLPEMGVKSFSHIKSHEGGETLYLGSRTSELFMRIYNKAAEQGNKPENPKDWIRIELECKGERAKQIGVMVALRTDNEIVALTRGLVKSMADFPDKAWQRAVGDTPITIGKSQVKSSKTRAWLLETIAPAMARYISENADEKLLGEFLEVVKAYTKPDKGLTNIGQ